MEAKTSVELLEQKIATKKAELESGNANSGDAVSQALLASIRELEQEVEDKRKQ